MGPSSAGNLPSMAHLEDLENGLNYDLWANKAWLECLQSKGAPPEDLAILGHILSAQTIWLLRCQGESLDRLPVVEPTVETMTEISERWLKHIKNHPDDIIHFHRTTGEAHSASMHEILLHVINHGTYHRGELRGLCLARGDENFPETDRMKFMLGIR